MSRAGNSAISSASRISVVAMLLSFAVVIHFVEAIIPLPIPVPGVRLGLANIITLLTLIILGFPPAMLVAVGRVILGGLLSGGFMGFGFWLSLGGAVFSCSVMALVMPLYHKKYISAISVSIMGAVSHNMMQLALAGLIMQNIVIIRGYLPFLVLAAVPTGFLTGMAVFYLADLTRKNTGRIT